MPFEFKFPDVGEGITEGEIVRWHVREGQPVQEHDVLVEIETDKAVVQIPSPRSGTILKILHKEGDTVKVGETLVVIETGEKIEEKEVPTIPKAAIPSLPAVRKKWAGVVGELEEAPDEEKPSTEADRAREAKRPQRGELKATEERHIVIGEVPSKISAHVLATPSVRRLARELSVDLSLVRGTGLDGRITEEDVRKSAGKKEEAEGVREIKIQKKYDFFGYIEHVPLKGIRKATARHMSQAWQNAVHVSHMDEADVTRLVEHREREKAAAAEKGVHLTYLPFFIKAAIAALKQHPYLNATLDEEHEEIILKKYYNIGVAVDTPDGLLVPVVKGADAKSILDIAKEIEILASKAKERKLDLADMKGGTFTITNIGVLGGKFATPIINYPEVAILLPGRIYQAPRVVDGEVVVRWVLPFTVTFDHRVLDGAEAVRFANDFKKYVEDPDLLLVEGEV
jgi:pyruvate dehydrogenase E2 component (dihydrolipoamide acetyltransferase)